MKKLTAVEASIKANNNFTKEATKYCNPIHKLINKVTRMGNTSIVVPYIDGRHLEIIRDTFIPLGYEVKLRKFEDQQGVLILW